MKKTLLKGSQARKIINEFNTQLKLSIPSKKSPVEVITLNSSNLYYVNSRPLIISIDSVLIPTLIFNEACATLPKVKIDRGAVSPICKGADIMAPGIREITKAYNEGDLVTVEEEDYGRILSIGIALVTSEETENLKHGKAIRNLHHVGDAFWKYLRDFYSK